MKKWLAVPFALLLLALTPQQEEPLHIAAVSITMMGLYCQAETPIAFYVSWYEEDPVMASVPVAPASSGHPVEAEICSFNVIVPITHDARYGGWPVAVYYFYDRYGNPVKGKIYEPGS